MKIKFYIITYNNDTILNEWILKSLNESNYSKENTNIYIINNFSDHINIFNEYSKNISYVYHNTLRPDFSTGHLARNHNQAIINGFKNLNDPDCDLVIVCQNDTIVEKDWYENVLNLSKMYDYCSFGAGDQFQIFKPECIKNVGLYDERYCNIGYQEADYLLRCLLYLEKKSSINDYQHGRLLNIYNNNIIQKTLSGFNRQESSHIESFKHHDISGNFFHEKWKCNANHWNDSLIHKTNVLNSKAPFVKTWMLYPYFEKNINYEIYK